MKTHTKHIAAAIVSALACAGPVRAHHSIGMFDISTPLWATGRVVSYRPGAPHSIIELEEGTEDGRIRRWTVEGPGPARLGRILRQQASSAAVELIRPGDTIEVCGFALKKAGLTKNPYAADASSDRFMHGHLIVMSDGRMQSWGAYGKMQNCVRPGDEPQRWIDFLNADALARELWCHGLDDYHRQFATLPRPAFVDEVTRRMDSSCE